MAPCSGVPGPFHMGTCNNGILFDRYLTGGSKSGPGAVIQYKFNFPRQNLISVFLKLQVSGNFGQVFSIKQFPGGFEINHSTLVHEG